MVLVIKEMPSESILRALTGSFIGHVYSEKYLHSAYTCSKVNRDGETVSYPAKELIARLRTPRPSPPHVIHVI